MTTTSLALAAVWPTDRQLLLVEADPSGGVLAARFGLLDRPGLVSLAAAVRNGWRDDALWSAVQTLPGGVPVVVAPPGANQTVAGLRDLSKPLADWAKEAVDTDVIVDCGRIPADPPTRELLSAADHVWIVTSPMVDMLRPTIETARFLETLGVTVSLVLRGELPYGRDDVEVQSGYRVVGVMTDDRRSASALTGVGSGRGFGESSLIRSARTLLDQVTDGVGTSR